MVRPKRPVRNIAARSWCADVRRFFRLINTDEVFGTHRSTLLIGSLFSSAMRVTNPELAQLYASHNVALPTSEETHELMKLRPFRGRGSRQRRSSFPWVVRKLQYAIWTAANVPHWDRPRLSPTMHRAALFVIDWPYAGPLGPSLRR